MKIKILNERPMQFSAYSHQEGMVDISDEELGLLTSGRPCMWVDGHVVLDEEMEAKQGYGALKNILRKQREVECFTYINRGSLWYSKLSEEQVNELEKWYEAWLNVTETLEAPTKPEWLN